MLSAHDATRRFVALLLAAVMSAAQAQQVAPAQSSPAAPPAASSSPVTASQPRKQKLPTGSERRRATSLYLEGSKLYTRQKFEQALADFNEAAQLDPTSDAYATAAQIARSHAATALIQSAAQSRTRGDRAGARAALEHALDLDPQNPSIRERLDQIDNPVQYAGDGASGEVFDAERPRGPALGGFDHLEPSPGQHSFHQRGNQRQIIQAVFREYGIDATVDDSIRSTQTRIDLDNATFREAMRAVSMLTHSFQVVIDPHRVLVANDTREMRLQYMRNGVETIPLPGLTANEMTDMGNMARNVFGVQQTAVDATAATITLRAPARDLNAFNTTYRDLMEGRSEVLIDIRVYQLAHTNARNTGVQPPQTINAFNVYAEERSILNQNQALVQQIISSGLASPGDTLAILGILLASGQVSSSIFSNGIALFGGGLTLSGVSPSPANLNLSLNSSDSRELDQFQLRLADGEEGTLKSGTRYPITTSSYSSLGTSNLNIPGLTSTGTSSSLSALQSSLTGTSINVPMVQYQDLGLVLKATPRVLRSGDVAINMDMKISALAGSSINGVPVLANRSYAGVATVPADQAVVIASEMDRNESRAISGYPGLSELPGLNDITQKDTQQNYATLLIVMTPRVVRSPHGLGHSPLLSIGRNLLR